MVPLTPSDSKSAWIKPRIIIHGGAGNILHETLPEASYQQYRAALLRIVQDAQYRLSLPEASALDVATFAVTQLENNPLFNSGHGAVFTTDGTHELEASVMVSRAFHKRGVGVMGVTRVKNPILLAREMLVRGEQEDGGGAHGHSQLHGETCLHLAKEWGLEMETPSYFWTRRRWDEHRRGLGLCHDDDTYERARHDADEMAGLGAMGPTGSGETVRSTHAGWHDPSWDGHEYLPQGTVGAVVLDARGSLCVATSTGGLTNKLPGRIGDTPTLGAGFWAEEWQNSSVGSYEDGEPSIISSLQDCLPDLAGYPRTSSDESKPQYLAYPRTRAVAMSGTGNGDSFLRTNAVRTAAAIARFSSAKKENHSTTMGSPSLQSAVTAVAGPSGVLQESAGNRWTKSGEGEGGIIGIDLVNGEGVVVADFNCGGMFRAWIDDHGKERMAVFRQEGFR